MPVDDQTSSRTSGQASGQASGDEHIGRRDLTSWPSRFGRALARIALSSTRAAAANWVLVVTAGIGGLVAMGLTAASAEVYDAVEDGGGLAGLDRPVLDAAIRLRTPGNEQAVTWFTNLGGTLGMTVLATCVTVALTIRWRSRTPLLLMVIAVLGSVTMTSVGKALVGRVRPPQLDAVPPFEHSPSFPSGHTLNSTVIAMLVAYLVVRRISSARARVATVALAGAWALAMGLSRVFLGHHWLTDVVFGWTLGLAWLAVVVTAHRLFLTVRRARREPAQAGDRSPYGQ